VLISVSQSESALVRVRRVRPQTMCFLTSVWFLIGFLKMRQATGKHAGGKTPCSSIWHAFSCGFPRSGMPNMREARGKHAGGKRPFSLIFICFRMVFIDQACPTRRRKQANTWAARDHFHEFELVFVWLSSIWDAQHAGGKRQTRGRQETITIECHWFSYGFH
jgi:hypothetical protein